MNKNKIVYESLRYITTEYIKSLGIDVNTLDEQKMELWVYHLMEQTMLSQGITDSNLINETSKALAEFFKKNN